MGKTLITRRKAIRGAVAFMGGTVAATQITPLIDRATAAVSGNSGPACLNADQFHLVERMVDLMIPETDTPGAYFAGVHYFIDMMLDEWASPERQDRFVAGIDELGQRLGSDFASASPDDQLEHLRAVDDEAYGGAANDDFFREFKRLALFGYYSSEAGATIELQYEAVTPDYKACVPINDIGRAWFWLGFSHDL